MTPEDVLASGQAAVEHLNDFDDAIEADHSLLKGRFHWSKPLLGIPIDAARATAIAERMARAGVWSVPTLVQADRSLAQPPLMTSWMNEPGMRYIPAEGMMLWGNQLERSVQRMDDEDWKRVADGRRNRLEVGRVLRAAGVKLLAGTDTPNTFVVPGFSLVLELENLVAAWVS